MKTITSYFRTTSEPNNLQEVSSCANQEEEGQKQTRTGSGAPKNHSYHIDNPDSAAEEHPPSQLYDSIDNPKRRKTRQNRVKNATGIKQIDPNDSNKSVNTVAEKHTKAEHSIEVIRDIQDGHTQVSNGSVLKHSKKSKGQKKNGKGNRAQIIETDCINIKCNVSEVIQNNGDSESIVQKRPRGRPRKVLQTSKNDTERSKSKSKKAEVDDSLKENDNAKFANVTNGEIAEKVKTNAFQLMMDSRHKSIGRNSPGKELTDEDNAQHNNHSEKQTKEARKKILQAWAESKGAAKRKREYEETGNCINHKLEKRAKKLKKMLQVEENVQERTSGTKKDLTPKSDKSKLGDFEDSPMKKHKSRLTKNSLNRWKIQIQSSLSKAEELNGNEETNLGDHDSKRDKPAGVNTLQTPNEDDDEEGFVDISNKRVLRKRNKNMNIKYVLSDDDDDDDDDEMDTTMPVKMAPVFLKATPKPKPDPQIVEARRQFLLSGVPSSLKKDITRQQSTEEKTYYDTFPVVTHVQQKSSDSSFWNLPKADLLLTEWQPLNIKPICCHSLTAKPTTAAGSLVVVDNLKPLCSVKPIVKEIKAQNPNYPVYKVFKSLYSKREPQNKIAEEREDEKKKRGRKKKKRKMQKKHVVDDAPPNGSVWTEKYRAQSSEDILGNNKSITTLKHWFTNWFSVRRKLKADADGSDSEFEVSDTTSRDSTEVVGNTVILKGPHGCGKSAAVYAICSELKFNVLEINASSKRTGKRLLQELQEATQSHQVRKEHNTLLSLVNDRTRTPKNEDHKDCSAPKMCVLLVEDVDLVFDQDDGFICALSQIMLTSKRPIVLTTTDETSLIIQKFLNQYQVIEFFPLTPSILGVWLQLVCLVEGALVDLSTVAELLDYNKGDVRKTLLDLQYWVGFNGQLKSQELNGADAIWAWKPEQHDVIAALVDDDNSNLSMPEESDYKSYYVHKDCVRDLKTVHYGRNLESVWWNLPHILNWPKQQAQFRLKDSPSETADAVQNTTEEINHLQEKIKLEVVAELYDSFTIVDMLRRSDNLEEGLSRRCRSKLKAGVSLEETTEVYRDLDFISDFGNKLIEGRLQYSCQVLNIEQKHPNTAVPGSAEKRWHSKQISCIIALQSALQPLTYAERSSTYLDYLPILRTIARSEQHRASNNTKRGNRFYNYLRSLGCSYSESDYRSACCVFDPSDIV